MAAKYWTSLSLWFSIAIGEGVYAIMVATNIMAAKYSLQILLARNIDFFFSFESGAQNIMPAKYIDTLLLDTIRMHTTIV